MCLYYLSLWNKQPVLVLTEHQELSLRKIMVIIEWISIQLCPYLAVWLLAGHLTSSPVLWSSQLDAVCYNSNLIV